MRILFRTHGSSKIGLGHAYRCLSLAKGFFSKTKEVEITFVINKGIEFLYPQFKIINSEEFDEKDIQKITELHPSIIIFDSYHANSTYLEKLRKIAKLIMFDDNNDLYGEVPCHFLINGNIQAESLNYKAKYKDTIYYLGPKYLVMKPDYWNAKINQNPVPNSILITTGGGDPQNITLKFIQALKGMNLMKNVCLGPMFLDDQIETIKKTVDSSFNLIFKPNSLIDHINASEFVISAAGQTVYEILTLRKMPILFVYAHNQEIGCNFLVNERVHSFGWYETIDWNKARKNIEKIIVNKSEYYHELTPLFEKFDGKGTLRLVDNILKNL